MIFLFIFAMSAMAEEPIDRSADLFKVFCDNCHGDRMEKIPLKKETSSEERLRIINEGKGTMPPYNWVLKEGEAEKFVIFLENMSKK